jgi:hypothetical protein
VKKYLTIASGVILAVGIVAGIVIGAKFPSVALKLNSVL